MVKDVRITYRRRCSYKTKSNRIRPVKTPGGRLVAHYIEKKSKGPICPVTGKAIIGVPRLRPKQYKRLSARERTVSRAYGGSLSAGAVRERILRAFIVEEQKVVKAVLKSAAAAKKASDKEDKAKKSSKGKKSRK